MTTPSLAEKVKTYGGPQFFGVGIQLLATFSVFDFAKNYVIHRDSVISKLAYSQIYKPLFASNAGKIGCHATWHYGTFLTHTHFAARIVACALGIIAALALTRYAVNKTRKEKDTPKENDPPYNWMYLIPALTLTAIASYLSLKNRANF